MESTDLRGRSVLVLAPGGGAGDELGRKLDNQGMTVFAAATQSAALDVLADERTEVDLVIVNLALPDLVGFSFARIVKTWMPDLPVLFLAPYDDRSVPEDELAARCVEALRARRGGSGQG